MSRRQKQRRKTTSPQRPMLWLLLGGIVLLTLGSLVVLLRQATPGAAVPVQVNGSPRLAVDRDQIDFGSVPLNRFVKATFKLSNIGDQPLMISHPSTAQVVEGC